MTGIGMLLAALGIKIDPDEAVAVFEKIKVDLPATLEVLKATFAGIEKQLAHQNEQLESICSLMENYHGRLLAIEGILTVASEEEKKDGGGNSNRYPGPRGVLN